MNWSRALLALAVAAVAASSCGTPTKPSDVTLSALALNSASVIGGTTAKAVITLMAPAPSGGASVSLSAASPLVTVPQTVTIPSGTTSATFDIVTTAVSASTNVTITAAYKGANVTATLTLTAQAPGLVSVTVNPPAVTGGTSSQGTVTLSPPAPVGGAVISLSASDVTMATVPISVTVPAGATSALFTITTSTVVANADVVITGLYGGTTRSATLSVMPAPPSLLSLGVPSGSVKGGNSVVATVTLSGAAPAGGASIALSSSAPAASVPVSVTIPAGGLSATFNIATGPVTSDVNAVISASYGGTTKTVTLKIVP